MRAVRRLLVVLPALLLISAVAAKKKRRAQKHAPIVCDHAIQRRPKEWIPPLPCDRDEISRHDICSLAYNPVNIANLSSNARVYPDRYTAVVNAAPRRGRFVEVGTLTGRFADHIVERLEPAEMVIIDVEERWVDLCKWKRNASIAAGTASCILGDSTSELTKLQDSRYDMIYVDGAHDYKGVCRDLEAARTKIKPGGLLVLNDYYLFETLFLAQRGRWGVYGIIHAANEFAARYHWELAYVAMHPRAEFDVAFRRPAGSWADSQWRHSTGMPTIPVSVPTKADSAGCDRFGVSSSGDRCTPKDDVGKPKPPKRSWSLFG